MVIFYLHMTLMVLMCFFIIGAVIIAKKRAAGWFPKHRLLALLGVTCGVFGAGFMFYSKAVHGWPHFKTLHALGGGMAAILLLSTPVFGYLASKGKDSLRPVHRVFGRLTAIMVLLVLATGVVKLLQTFGIMKK